MIKFITDGKIYISGSYGSKNFNVPYSEELLGDITVKAEDMDKVLKSSPTKERVKNVLDSFEELITVDYKIKDGKVYGSELLRLNGAGDLCLYVDYRKPILLTEKTAEYIDNLYKSGNAIEPYVNMLIWFYYGNPKATAERVDALINRLKSTYTDEEAAKELAEKEGISREKARLRCTYPDVQITSAGLIAMYKVVDERKWKYELDEEGCKKRVPIKDDVIIDAETGEMFKATNRFIEDMIFEPAIYKNGAQFYCGNKLGYIYKIGCTHALPDWDHVDMNDNVKHSGGGLYCGSLKYVEKYKSSCTHVMKCFVNPANIGKFTDEGNGEITAKELYIYDCVTCPEDVEGLYLESSYKQTALDDLIAAITEVDKDINDSIESVVALKNASKYLENLVK